MGSNKNNRFSTLDDVYIIKKDEDDESDEAFI